MEAQRNAVADEEEKDSVDHELDVRCKVYENGRMAADPEKFGFLEARFPAKVRITGWQETL